MRYIEVEDLTGSIEVIIFPSLVKRFDELTYVDKIVTISGNLDISEDAPPKIRLENINLLDTSAKRKSRLYIRFDSRDGQTMTKVKEILRDANGDTEVVIKILKYKFLKYGRNIKAE